MTQKEKSLLLQDLCARFMYGIIVRVHDIEHGDFDSYVDNISNTCIETHPVEELTMEFNPYVFYKLQEIKPYLRTMSSMTKEEERELTEINCQGTLAEYKYAIFYRSQDWLNKKMFDYRGLIEKGLAIEVTKENNPYE